MVRPDHRRDLQHRRRPYRASGQPGGHSQGQVRDFRAPEARWDWPFCNGDDALLNTPEPALPDTSAAGKVESTATSGSRISADHGVDGHYLHRRDPPRDTLSADHPLRRESTWPTPPPSPWRWERSWACRTEEITRGVAGYGPTGSRMRVHSPAGGQAHPGRLLQRQSPVRGQRRWRSWPRPTCGRKVAVLGDMGELGAPIRPGRPPAAWAAPSCPAGAWMR